MPGSASDPPTLPLLIGADDSNNPSSDTNADAELTLWEARLTRCLQDSHIPPFYEIDPLLLDQLDSLTTIMPPFQDSQVQSQDTTVQQHPPAISSGLSPFFNAPVATDSTNLQLCWDNYVTESHLAFMSGIMSETVPMRGTACDQLEPSSPTGLISSGGPDGGSTSTSVLQVGSPTPSQECDVLWEDIPMKAIVITGTNIFVPQTRYEPSTDADKNRYLEQVTLLPPIIFETQDPEIEWGISLQDIRNGNMQRLIDKDVPVLQACGPSIAIRIGWPGYPPFKRQVSSRNYRKKKGPITKAKLAQKVAKVTDKFIEKMSNRQTDNNAPASDSNWKPSPREQGELATALSPPARPSWGYVNMKLGYT